MARENFNSKTNIKTLPTEASRYEIGDAEGNGLRLRVSPNGTKTFIWRVRFESRQRIVTLGDHPAMSVNQARSRLDEVKQSYADGVLFTSKITRKAPTTVRQLALEYQAEAMASLSEGRKEQVRMAMDKYILPTIGSAKLRSIKAPQVKVVVTKVLNAGYNERARAVLGILGRMFRYAEALGYIDYSPAAALEPSFCGIEKAKSRTCMLNNDGIRTFWSALDKTTRMSGPVRIALRILLLSGVRSGELRQAKWKHVDFDKAEWFIPEENSKTNSWTVPLSSHLLALFRELHDLTGDTIYLFPGIKKDGKLYPITNRVYHKAMVKMFNDGFMPDVEKVSPHDFRRLMRTTMAESLNIDDSVAEACLNHVKGKVEGAYNKAQLLTQRRAALEKWGDYVDLLVHPCDNIRRLANAG